MNIEPLSLEGAWLIESQPVEDERGFFARLYCHEKFTDHGLNTQWVQHNQSFNQKKGILRGLHFQTGQHSECKLVTCLSGAVYDVIVDLRIDSPTYLQWLGLELNEENHRLLYIPAGFAHGYQTLSDTSLIYYQMSEPYSPECSCGVRWDDKAFNIEWPDIENRIISPADQGWKDFIV